jgi:CDGSH-type Zn-finger protein/uncharacterized Fe-S cluster protein YjdI
MGDGASMTDQTTNLAVNDREELIYLLTEAAEFEHTVMCTYLYAQWTLKRDESEGVTRTELEAIDRWRNALRIVALEEMLHLSLVNNLLAAFGAAPHFSRPDFPVRQGYFPSSIDFHLAPFDEETIEHFVFIERPEGIDVQDGDGFAHESHYQRVSSPDLLTPTPRDYGSQGHLYHGIAQAIRRLAAGMGEDALFVGHGEAQVSSAEFPLPGLFAVTGVDSAIRALEEIVLQGEGAPADREDSHYARFAAILNEYRALKQERPDFTPAHPAAVNPVLTEFTENERITRITNPTARRIVDLGNSVYSLMVHTLAQVCAPAPLPAALRQGLADASSELMRLTTTLGEAAARTPARNGGPNAGLSFALPRSFGQLVQANAAQILAERARELGAAARHLEGDAALQPLAAELETLGSTLAKLHAAYEGHFTPAHPRTEPAQPSPPAAPASDEIPDAADADNTAASDDIRIHFDVDRCIHSRSCVLGAPQVFLANVEGPWLHPEKSTAEQLVHVAQSCPSGAITYERLDGGDEELAPEVNVIHIRENGPYAFHAELQMDGAGRLFRATLCRCGKSGNKPFCDNSHIQAGFSASGEPETTPSEPLEERGGALQVSPVQDGPLAVRGPVEICAGTGRTVNRTQNVRLCRCGGSGNKPFCDGSHSRIGFKS